jgi:2-polyprenyl-3-methyl-5-hydroxy-6-metoxy-1,4-benzoquinol methylase
VTTPVFDSHADQYETDCMRGLAVSGESKEFFARGRLAYLEAALRRMDRGRPQRIVDFGCGIGDVTALLAETYPQATILGVDSSPRCVERAVRAHAGERVSFAPIGASTEAPPASFDLLHMNGVVHHVPPPDRTALMDTVSGLVRPGGVVAIFENNPLNPGTRLVMSRIPFDKGTEPITAWNTRRLMRAAGLQVVETAYLFYFPRILSALRPVEPFLTRVPLGAQYVVIAAKHE